MEKKNIVSAIMKGDNWLWGIYLTLLCISLVEMFSASSRLAYLPSSATYDSPAFSHARHLLLGLALALLCQSSTRMLFRYVWDWAIFIGGLGLLFAMFIPGVGTTIKGEATRSIMGMQPVEICKVGLMIFLCVLITAQDSWYHHVTWFRVHTQGRRFWTLLFFIGITAIPIATQNLSSAMIICFASMGVMFIGGVPLRYLWRLCLAALIFGAIALAALKVLNTDDEMRKAHNQEQIDLWKFDRAHTWASRIFGHDDDTRPLWEQDPDGENSQVIHAHMALANGVPIPQGPGNSKLRDFLPEAYSDYIYSIIFEEWGILGGGFVLLLYLTLLARAYILSRRTRDPYLRLMMIALPLVMVVQALLHIGVCTDAMFVTGQPLPLISHGGSGILMTSISFGLMFALSRLIDAENKERQQEETATSELVQS